MAPAGAAHCPSTSSMPSLLFNPVGVDDFGTYIYIKRKRERERERERKKERMVSDEEISEALKCVWRESKGVRLSNLNQLLQLLQSKLGVHDLSPNLHFITQQIHLLFGSQQPPQPHQQQPQQQQQQPPQHQHQQPPPPEDHFALHHNPNFQTSPTALPASSSILNFSSATVSPLAHASAAPTQPHSLPATTHLPNQGIQPKAKRRGGPGGLNKLCGVSPELQVIVGHPALPRTEIVKQLWAYIRKNNLQDPSNKRKIICNDELRVVFETDCTDMFKMNKLLAKHIITLEPTKQPVPKKQKVEAESGTISAQPAPLVIISDALANFFGIAGREMLQSEVLRRIWEYIKVKQLEDPVNPMTIVCDAKLQELFGCESISALGIPEVLGRHHIIRRS
ncbi:unnamed protein product [Lupinus luteus]|uniref:DM2 domain-containing protein n=1 Tax=Lupinus luteus TaxID=3873 RepID=A0AAV1WHV3_LUPLU